MATVGTRVTFAFKDSNNREVKTTLFFPSTVVTPNDSNILSIATKLQACSCATLTSVAISQDGDQVATPAATAYSSCLDKLLLEMDNAAGESSNWKLPAPIQGSSGPIQSDNSTLNEASTLVTAFVAAVMSYVTTRGGTTFPDDSISGHRIERKRLKY